jgi:hypothetical protein
MGLTKNADMKLQGVLASLWSSPERRGIHKVIEFIGGSRNLVIKEVVHLSISWISGVSSRGDRVRKFRFLHLKWTERIEKEGEYE